MKDSAAVVSDSDIARCVLRDNRHWSCVIRADRVVSMSLHPHSLQSFDPRICENIIKLKVTMLVGHAGHKNSMQFILLYTVCSKKSDAKI